MLKSPGSQAKLQDESGAAQSQGTDLVGIVMVAPGAAYQKEPQYISNGSEQLVELFGSAQVGYDNYVATKKMVDMTAAFVYNVPHTITGTNKKASVGLESAGNVKVLTVSAKKSGEGGNDLKIMITNSVAGAFDMVVADKTGRLLEKFSGVSLDKWATGYFGFLVSDYVTVEVASGANITTALILDKGDFALTGGSSASITVTDADLADAIDELSDMDKYGVNYLVVPCYSHRKAILAELSTKLPEDGTIECFIAPPLEVTKAQDVVNWSNGELAGADYPTNAVNNSQLEVYAPWISVLDSEVGGEVWISPEVAVLQARLFTNANYYPWVAPAGATRGKVSVAVSLKTYFSRRDRDLLLGGVNVVNPISKVGKSGFLIYGQKTSLRRPTAQLTRVNTRALQNYIQRVIMPASDEYVFEPNIQATWDNWVNMADGFMKGLKEKGAVYGYKVKMEPTDEEIDRFEMPGYIGYQPVKDGEFVYITFNLKSKSSTL